MPALAQRIQDSKDRLVSIKDRLTEIKSILEEDNSETETDELYTEVETLETEFDAVTKRLTGDEKLEANLAKKAQPIARKTSKVEHKDENGKPFDLLVKTASANLIAYQERKTIAQVLHERYTGDMRLEAINKTVTNVADSTTVGWAAELVDNEIRGFLDLLVGTSVYAALASRSMQFTFGNAGSISIPRRTGTSRLSGAWVGEGGNIPVKQGSFASTTLNRYKLGIISGFTKEVSRSSTPNIESIVRRNMMTDTAEALDGSMLDANAAVAGVRPAGIFNGVTPTTSAGTSAANIATDLKAALAPLIASNSMGAPVWLIHENIKLSLMTVTSATGEYLYRDEMSRGTLLGYPFISSTNIPDDTLTALDVSQLATAFGAPEIDTNDYSTLVMANADGTAPTHAIDAAGALGTAEQVLPDGGIDVVPRAAVAGGAGVAGYYAQSMFQTWSTAIRLVMPASFAFLRTGAIGQVDSIAW